MNPALMSAKRKIEIHSHCVANRKENPSRMSEKIDVAGFGARIGRERMNMTARAETKNVNASNAKAAGGPTVATRSPPRTGPPIRAAWRDSPRTAFPGTRISSGTSSGMSAPRAGPLNEYAAPKSATAT
jgi:hypothetical protein